MNFFKFSTQVVILAALTSFSTVSQADIRENGYKGLSSLTPFYSNHVMSLLIKKDTTADSKSYYAILSEYDILGGTDIVAKLGLSRSRHGITKWINRIYAYKVEEVVANVEYRMLPIFVSPTGEIETREDITASVLKLGEKGTLEGAVISRFDTKSNSVVETIRFDGSDVGSSWEKFIAGKFLGTHKSSGLDYFKNEYNMEITNDRVVHFNQVNEITGDFNLNEKVPDMLFTMTPKSSASEITGLEHVENRIAFFLDIVNQKPRKTNDEILLINPTNPEDIGFYYERENIKNK